LQSKVFEAERHPQHTLALAPGGQLPLEEAIKVAAKWVTVMESRGFHVGLVAGKRYPPDRHSAHRLALLRALALYQGEPSIQIKGDEVLISFAA
jgi:uncharacterized protein (DUF58 family)